jgi:hypothetical protein
MRIRIRILPLTFFQIWTLQNDHPRLPPFKFHADPDPAFDFDADSAFHFDADPNSAFHFDADPDPASQNDADPCGSGTLPDRLTSRLQMLELNASLVPDMSCRSPMVVRVRVGSLRLPRRMSLTLSGVRSLRLRIS